MQFEVEPDPIVGAERDDAAFVIPADTVRLRVSHLRCFVTVRGGAYFFLRSALRYLSRLVSTIVRIYSQPEPSSGTLAQFANDLPVFRRKLCHGRQYTTVTVRHEHGRGHHRKQ